MMGSLPYMAPEQLRGERVDGRADLFNLGILIHELISGRPPWVAPDETVSAQVLLERMQEAPPPLPAGPRWLRRLTGRLLAAKPGRRPETATDVRRRLERRLGSVSPRTTARGSPAA